MKRSVTITSIIVGALLLGFGIVFATYVSRTQHETQLTEEAKLDVERRRAGERMRALGRQSAEENLKHPLTLPPDPLAPAEASDAEELAQAKRWHETPPSQRKKLLPSAPQDAGADDYDLQ